MIIGKDAPLGPSCVKASNISSTSAVISWLPSNSNFQHTVRHGAVLSPHSYHAIIQSEI